MPSTEKPYVSVIFAIIRYRNIPNEIISQLKPMPMERKKSPKLI